MWTRVVSMSVGGRSMDSLCCSVVLLCRLLEGPCSVALPLCSDCRAALLCRAAGSRSCCHECAVTAPECLGAQKKSLARKLHILSLVSSQIVILGVFGIYIRSTFAW